MASVEEKIGLVRNKITDPGAQTMLRAIERNTSLNEIWFDDTFVSDRMRSRLTSISKAVELRKNWGRAIAFCSAREGPSLIQDFPEDVMRLIMSMLYSGKENSVGVENVDRSGASEGEDEEQEQEEEENDDEDQAMLD
jgi:hypothetical protein